MILGKSHKNVFIGYQNKRTSQSNFLHKSKLRFAAKKVLKRYDFEEMENKSKNKDESIINSLIQITKIQMIIGRKERIKWNRAKKLDEELKNRYILDKIWNDLSRINQEIKEYDKYIKQTKFEEINGIQKVKDRSCRIKFKSIKKNIVNYNKKYSNNLQLFQLAQTLSQYSQKINILAYQLSYPSLYLKNTSSNHTFHIAPNQITFLNHKYNLLVQQGIYSYLKYSIYNKKIYSHLAHQAIYNQQQTPYDYKYFILHIYTAQATLLNKIIDYYMKIHNQSGLQKFQQIKIEQQNSLFNNLYENIGSFVEMKNSMLINQMGNMISSYRIKGIVRGQNGNRIHMMRYIVCNIQGIKQLWKKLSNYEMNKKKQKWLVLYELSEQQLNKIQFQKKMVQCMRIMKNYGL